MNNRVAFGGGGGAGTKCLGGTTIYHTHVFFIMYESKWGEFWFLLEGRCELVLSMY